MKKTGLAVFFVLVILLGLLAGQLGIAHPALELRGYRYGSRARP